MDLKRSLQLETLLEPAYIASDFMATDDRPLQEMRAPERLKKGVAFELRRCPYSGSRYEKDMNASALASLSKELRVVVSDTINLRTAYLKHIGAESFNLRTFWLFIRMLDSAPAYLVRHQPELSNKDNIPANISAMFKAAQGLHHATELILLDGKSPESIISTEELMEVIESRGLFIGDDDRACSGPLAMVLAFIASAMDGKGKYNDIAELESQFGNDGIKGLFNYSDAVSRVFACKVLFEANCRSDIVAFADNLNCDSFISNSKQALARFGVLRTRDIQTIGRVKAYFKNLGKSPPPTKETWRLNNSSRLQKMISLRNPNLSIEICKIATSFLIKNIIINQQWMSIFTEEQEAVLQTLGVQDSLPRFRSNDFSGLGYIPAVLLSLWLNMEILILDDHILIKAGASIERFNWEKIS